MSNIAPLLADWLTAKEDEARANKRRIEIEAQICAVIVAPDEGSKTHEIDGYKVTLTQPITRKLDEKAWAKVADKCPEVLRPVKTKMEADGTGCKWLAENEPAIWKRISGAFEVKPGKIGVKVVKGVE